MQHHIELVHHKQGQKRLLEINCISKLGFALLVKHDCAPKTVNFAHSHENTILQLCF